MKISYCLLLYLASLFVQQASFSSNWIQKLLDKFSLTDRVSPFFCKVIVKDQDQVYYDTFYTQECIDEKILPAFKTFMHKLGDFRKLEYSFFGKKIETEINCEELNELKKRTPVFVCLDEQLDRSSSKCTMQRRIEQNGYCWEKTLEMHRQDVANGKIHRGEEFTLNEFFNIMQIKMIDKPIENQPDRKLINIMGVHGIGMDSRLFLLKNTRFSEDRKKVTRLKSRLWDNDEFKKMNIAADLAPYDFVVDDYGEKMCKDFTFRMSKVASELLKLEKLEGRVKKILSVKNAELQWSQIHKTAAKNTCRMANNLKRMAWSFAQKNFTILDRSRYNQIGLSEKTRLALHELFILLKIELDGEYTISNQIFEILLEKSKPTSQLFLPIEKQVVNTDKSFTLYFPKAEDGGQTLLVTDQNSESERKAICEYFGFKSGLSWQIELKIVKGGAKRLANGILINEQVHSLKGKSGSNGILFQTLRSITCIGRK